MQEHESWQMPEWWFREERPTSDCVYFENMCRVIFQAGLNWQVIDNKWQTTKNAFANFNRHHRITYKHVNQIIV